MMRGGCGRVRNETTKIEALPPRPFLLFAFAQPTRQEARRPVALEHRATSRFSSGSMHPHRRRARGTRVAGHQQKRESQSANKRAAVRDGAFFPLPLVGRAGVGRIPVFEVGIQKSEMSNSKIIRHGFPPPPGLPHKGGGEVRPRLPSGSTLRRFRPARGTRVGSALERRESPVTNQNECRKAPS